MKNTKHILRALAGSLLALLMVITMTACPQTDDPPPPPQTGNVSSVAVAPGTATVELGRQQRFTATVSLTGNLPETVDWALAGNSSTSTTLVNGLLTVAGDETVGAETLTITATSVADQTKSGTAKVSVVTVATSPTVYSVSVDPGTATLLKSGTQQFTATVSVGDGAAQTVTWMVTGTGKKTGTVISETGLLTIAADEDPIALTVTATSTVDSTKSGTAAVTVVAELINSFAGTIWTDGVNPESTIDFTSDTQLSLLGPYWGPVDQDGATLTYLEYPDPAAAKIESAVIVYTDPSKRAGFELDYYQADLANGKAQRLVVWFKGNNLQPREFFKK